MLYRYADDVAMNREMREVERWNDPAAEFLTVCHISFSAPEPFPLSPPTIPAPSFDRSSYSAPFKRAQEYH
jgi:hypothetical protein